MQKNSTIDADKLKTQIISDEMREGDDIDAVLTDELESFDDYEFEEEIWEAECSARHCDDPNCPYTH